MRTKRRLAAATMVFLFFFLAALLCSCGRGVGRCAGDVAEVTYHNWTGHVLPAWSETYVITETRVRLTRTGEPATERPGHKVNAGEWEFDVDPQDAARLFEQLRAVDWASIVALPREDPAPIGGGSALYKVTCEGDSSAALWYGEGQRYTNGRAVTEPIEKFIVDLRLPQDASRTIPLDDPE